MKLNPETLDVQPTDYWNDCVDEILDEQNQMVRNKQARIVEAFKRIVDISAGTYVEPYDAVLFGGLFFCVEGVDTLPMIFAYGKGKRLCYSKHDIGSYVLDFRLGKLPNLRQQ